MKKIGLLVTVTFVVAAGGMLLSSRGNTGAPQGALPVARIQHVVIIVQENRTPDNLFHGLPNADIASTGLNSKRQTITLSEIALANNYDLAHEHNAFVVDYDKGKMDGWDRIGVACKPKAVNCPPPNPQYQYVNPVEVKAYFQMAERFTFADRMFQTNQGPSFPAHQFLISGTSAPTPNSTFFAAGNPGGYANADQNTGCTAPPTEWVLLIDPRGYTSTRSYPCYEHPTLTDLLDVNKVTWRYYTPSAGSIWTGPNAINHICQPQSVSGKIVCTGPDWTAKVIIPETQILTDIAYSKLPAVSWVIPNGLASDHALANDSTGPSWVASVVNAIGNSPYWANTAILVTWDDWGGWYDHVAPKIINSYEYGFRVPLIVVSPYARPAYVSHVTHDFGSILKFVETTFGLKSLGYADASADNLSDCFNFSQKPIPFQTIVTAVPAAHFLYDPRPVVDPDDD